MTISSTLASVICLGVFIVGCGTSQPNAALPAASSSKAITSDADVNAILETSCFQCHSSTGKAPWYAAVAPTYIASNSARNVLNFSDWSSYDAAKRADELKGIAQAVGAGSMPPGDYTALDHSASLTEDQKQLLLKWTAQPAH